MAGSSSTTRMSAPSGTAQCLLDPTEQLLDGERLVDHAQRTTGGGGAIRPEGRVVTGARHEQRPQRRPDAADPLVELDAGDVLHAEVAEHEVDLAVQAGDQLDRLPAGGRGGHLV